MDEARTTSMGSFERSFTELQNGHRFCYIFLIAWMLNTDKHVDDDCLKFEGKKSMRKVIVSLQIEIEAYIIDMEG